MIKNCIINAVAWQWAHCIHKFFNGEPMGSCFHAMLEIRLHLYANGFALL